MPQNFIGCDREQVLLMPPDLREWLPEGHLAWFLLATVNELDLASFYGAYRADGHGRAAHDPAMMLSVVLYAYCKGLRSSRAIERACVEDVAFRVIAANQAPDHTTIARFRVRHEAALAELFSDVLSLCAEAGLVESRVVAIDGTKVSANASMDANRAYERIAREILEEAKRVDEAEDALYGDKRGDELPEQLTTEAGRRAWLREAKRRLEEKRAKEARPVAQPRPKRLQESKRRLEEELFFEQRANALYEAWRERKTREVGRHRMAPGTVKPYQPPEVPVGRRINTTDPDSRIVKTAGQQAIQGYNAQAAVNDKQIVIAAEVTADSPDFGHLEPMVNATEQELEQLGADSPEVVLADAGYWHKRQMESIVNRGMQVLIPPDSGLRKGARPGWDKGLYAFMRRVLSTEHGQAIYRRRQATVEPVFAQMKFNRRLDRFLRRGRTACRSEWRLMAATHNLLKLHSHKTALTAA
jgi:transposase